jgi:hypothetical protein
MSSYWLSLTLRPSWQRTTTSLPDDLWVKKMSGASGRIRHLARKHGIRDLRGIQVARVGQGESFYLIALRHPRLELPSGRHHLLDAVSPSTAFLPIENDVSDRRLSLIGLSSRSNTIVLTR